MSSAAQCRLIHHRSAFLTFPSFGNATENILAVPRPWQLWKAELPAGHTSCQAIFAAAQIRDCNLEASAELSCSWRGRAQSNAPPRVLAAAV